jgi:hypothetical protein
MIRNWKEHGLHLDFSNIGVVCSDIDLFHITPSGFLIIGEIKNTKGIFKTGQRRLLQKIVDANSKGGTVIYITHTKDVNNGDTIVDISNCLVEEYYWKGEWITPYKFITVKEAMKKLEVY